MGPARSAGRLFSPLDEELGLLPGELTPLLHERLVQVGMVAKSFAAGAEVFCSFTRTPASEPTARRYTERAGAVMDECELEAGGLPPPEGDGDPRPRWVGADGVFVRLVGGAWREVRTVSLGLVNPAKLVQGKLQVTTSELSYFSRLTDSAEAFIDLVGAEFRRRGVAEAPLIGAGSDGADWCQRLFARHCPTALRSLDFYHAAERVQAFSKTLWEGHPALAQWYAANQLHRLKHEGPDPLLTSLSAWSQVSDPPQVQEAARAQHGYFSCREELLDYPAIRAAGLPIGTGNAESANLHVVQDRLKGPGKFWGKEHVNPMLALRGAWCSRRWEQAWLQASERLAAGHYPSYLFHEPKAKS